MSRKVCFTCKYLGYLSGFFFCELDTDLDNRIYKEVHPLGHCDRWEVKPGIEGLVDLGDYNDKSNDIT